MSMYPLSIADDVIPITPSDTGDIVALCGGGGVRKQMGIFTTANATVVVETAKGQLRTLNMIANQVVLVRVKRILATGTTPATTVYLYLAE